MENADKKFKARAIRILVIDDEPGFRDLMVFELGSRGYQVITAADGDEAIQKARSEDIDIVISDLTMPKRGGLETLPVLKSIDPSLELIMVTGYATLENAAESMRAGAFGFVTKPFQMEEIAGLVERAVKKRRGERVVGAPSSQKKGGDR